MTDDMKDLGVVGFCLFVVKELVSLMKNFGRKDRHNDFRIEVAIMQLAESVKNQTSVLEKSIDTQNEILSEMRREQAEMRREQFDQKTILARLEAKVG